MPDIKSMVRDQVANNTEHVSCETIIFRLNTHFTHMPSSIRPFIGALDFELSKKFYLDMGFMLIYDDPKMCFFQRNDLGFYLQSAYVKDWVDNTMIFLEVEDPGEELKRLKSLELVDKYKGVRLSEMVHLDWGKEFFLHDPSGILWHIGSFK